MRTVIYLCVKDIDRFWLVLRFLYWNLKRFRQRGSFRFVCLFLDFELFIRVLFNVWSRHSTWSPWCLELSAHTVVGSCCSLIFCVVLCSSLSVFFSLVFFSINDWPLKSPDKGMCLNTFYHWGGSKRMPVGYVMDTNIINFPEMVSTKVSFLVKFEIEINSFSH
jgi:hypothetical protein